MSYYNPDQLDASRKVSKAIEQGDVNRPKTCELCGKTPKTIKAKYANTIQLRAAIVGHHWNGYDNPLDVWWLCFRCNGILKGPEWHNGTATKQQAREYINSKR